MSRLLFVLLLSEAALVLVIESSVRTATRRQRPADRARGSFRSSHRAVDYEHEHRRKRLSTSTQENTGRYWKASTGGSVDLYPPSAAKS